MHAPRRMLILETMSRSALCEVHAISRPLVCCGSRVGRGGRIVIRMQICEDMPCHMEWSVMRLKFEEARREFGVRDTDTAPRSALGRSRGKGAAARERCRELQCDCARGEREATRVCTKQR